MTLHSGILYQSGPADAALDPVARLRAAVAEYETRHGKRPSLAVTKAADGLPETVDGVRVMPSPSIPYPTWVLLVDETTEELHERLQAG
jgi:hypothetical protein